MAITTDASLRIRPHRQNEYAPRTPITHDGPSPGLTGVDGIVSNQVTLWAQSGHVLVSQKFLHTETLAVGGFPFYLGNWSFQIPKWMNQTSGTWRRFLTFIVDTDLGATPTITMRVTTSLGTTTGVRTSYGGRWVTQFDVPLPASAPLPNDATWFNLTLEAEWSGSGSASFTATGVVGFIERVSGTLDNDANNPGSIDLVDGDQVTYQEALDVHTLRALHATNEVLFASNTRPVVTSGWLPGGTDDNTLDIAPAEGIFDLSDGPITNPPQNPYWEWVYFPRQGVTRLRVALAMFKLGINRQVYLGFRDSEYTLINVTRASTTVTLNSSFWQAVGNTYIDIPPGEGPLFLRLGLMPNASSDEDDGVRVTNISIHEEVLKGNTLT